MGRINPQLFIKISNHMGMDIGAEAARFGEVQDQYELWLRNYFNDSVR
jgi:hypothetical protein